MNSFVHSAGVIHMVRLTGVEPAHMASEATALSTELQAHITDKSALMKSISATFLIISFIHCIVNLLLIRK